MFRLFRRFRPNYVLPRSLVITCNKRRADSHCADDSKKLYTVKELASALKTSLQSIREKLKLDSMQIPPISVRLLRFDDAVGNPVETQILELTFTPSVTVDISLLATEWMSILNPLAEHKRISAEHVKKICAFYSDSKATALPVVSENKHCSMTLLKTVEPIRGSNKQRFRVSVSMFKDGGFTPSDVALIVKGYTGAFSSPFPGNHSFLTKRNNTSPVFRFTPSTNGTSADGGSQVFSDGGGRLPSIFSSTEFDSWLGGESGFLSNGDAGSDSSRPHPSHNGTKSTVDYDDDTLSETDSRVAAAIRTLEGLGVEVFDRSANACLSWDSLAGYTHVKKHIEDTIVNALQYPDIYDSVAAKTRVVFESNRPKAVLLEGPPGTGKTLTARILASQCERPLVVIRLESVVSKWFGDSEKKLSKIFDACDSLDGAIIFVDEIDSLAQSRDAEGGIHEVSKRMLSILLQRIEGFHGKGRSVLVCATNRKQDLDSALISRFDLIIPYALPDLHTRYEILRRYAKQFETATTTNGENDIYTQLANATEGLSCRAIKEVCEQAERLCASRLVAERRGALVKDSTASSSSSSAKADTKSGVSGLGSMFSFGSSSNNVNGKKSTQSTPKAVMNTEVPSLNDYMHCIEYRNQAIAADNRNRSDNNKHAVEC